MDVDTREWTAAAEMREGGTGLLPGQVDAGSWRRLESEAGMTGEAFSEYSTGISPDSVDSEEHHGGMRPC